MPENITWRSGTQSGERELPAAPPRRLARGGNGGQTASQGAARSHDMLFGAVVQHTHPHLLGCGNGKFGNAGLVEFGTQAELRLCLLSTSVDQQMRDFGQASTAIQAFADVL